MQFSIATLFACCFVIIPSVLGQSAVILTPQEGATAAVGQPLAVQVAVPNQLTGVEQFSVIISLLGCAGETCTIPASESLRNVLVADKNFSPEYHVTSQPPYTGYSVIIPEGTPSGPNTIVVTHFYLLGAGYTPILEFKNVTINVL